MNPRFVFSLLVAALLTSACGPTDAVEEPAEHPSVVVTQWNDSTELFLEYPELLAGRATGNWAIHMSDMKTFKPITQGTLVVRFLRDGTEAKAFTVDAPARDGIFLLDPVLDQPGTYQVRLELTSSQTRSTHDLPAVVVHADEAALPAVPAEEAGVGISFLKEQQWKIPFAVVPAEEQVVARSASAPAEIVARDGALAQVSAPTSGIALASANLNAPSIGTRVRSGDVLAVLAPTADAGGYARVRGDLARLEREAERAQRLYEAGAIPERRLQETLHDLEIARAEMAAIGSGADADMLLRVRAPISGVVAERTFVPGGRVEAGQPLFTVVDPSTVWLRVQLPAGAASGMSGGASTIFTVEGSPQTFTASRLVSIGSVLDPRTRTVPVVFEVPNEAGLVKVGQFARASVPVGGTVTGVAIPNDAILDDNGTPVAYVQTGGETFERRALTLGPTDGSRTAIAEGIRPGEMVVTVGAYQVRLASLSPEGFSGGHAH